MASHRASQVGEATVEDSGDTLGPLSVQVHGLEIEVRPDAGQWVAVIVSNPGLIAQAPTLEGALHQALHFERVSRMLTPGQYPRATT